MNGLDTEEWDPSRDPLLPPGARFAGFADSARGKSYAKHALQTRMGLTPDTRVGGTALLSICNTVERVSCLLRVCLVPPSIVSAGRCMPMHCPPFCSYYSLVVSEERA